MRRRWLAIVVVGLVAGLVVAVVSIALRMFPLGVGPSRTRTDDASMVPAVQRDLDATLIDARARRVAELESGESPTSVVRRSNEILDASVQDIRTRVQELGGVYTADSVPVQQLVPAEQRVVESQELIVAYSDRLELLSSELDAARMQGEDTSSIEHRILGTRNGLELARIGEELAEAEIAEARSR